VVHAVTATMGSLLVRMALHPPFPNEVPEVSLCDFVQVVGAIIFFYLIFIFRQVSNVTGSFIVKDRLVV